MEEINKDVFNNSSFGTKGTHVYLLKVCS